MTNEEVKRRLLDIERCTPIHTREDVRDFEALEMAIKALEQESCEDCISRQYLLNNCVVDKVTMPYVPVSKIENAPPVTLKQKCGYWIKYDNEYFTMGRLTPVIHSIRECSVCHMKIADFCGQMEYCPHCGAKMQESEVKE